jgi:uncharacterized protein YyaL (SSP411 family)
MARIENQRTVPIALLVVAAVLLIARIVSNELEPDPKAVAGVRWVPLAQAKTVAMRTGKPIMYDFTAEWCGPCHVLEKEVFGDGRLAALINERFVPVRVVDRQREDGVNPPEVAALAEHFRVRAFPTIVLVAPNGLLQTKTEGYRGAEAFEEMLESVR